MVWRAYLNNQSVQSATLLPDGKTGTYPRYIFIEDRELPIILTDEKSTGKQSWAVGVNDGKNPHYQLGYEGEGKIQITINEDASGKLTYNATSGFTTVTDKPL